MQRGHIVFIASIQGKLPTALVSVYNMARRLGANRVPAGSGQAATRKALIYPFYVGD
jgi:hypothetical protein